MVELKLDEYFLPDRVRECESGHDLTFRLEEHCDILSTTDLLALIYEYEIDIMTGIHEVFNDDVEPEENSDLALSPLSVKAYASPHRGLSRAGQRSSTDGSSRADICQEEVAGTKVRACTLNTILSRKNVPAREAHLALASVGWECERRVRIRITLELQRSHWVVLWDWAVP
ncbi:hypothetical protein BJV78DRAFT_1154246 [Lactifluus subvellereus]|nr:hypothetical protein BJV78DRAFT_1154246 [Lactifluus subvellereus]